MSSLCKVFVTVLHSVSMVLNVNNMPGSPALLQCNNNDIYIYIYI